MNVYQAGVMAGQEQMFRDFFGTSVVVGGHTVSVTTAQIADRKAGSEIFSHIGLDAYDEVADSRVFEFNAADLAPTTSVAVPDAGSTITWQGKAYTGVFRVPAVVSDVVKSQRVYAYYAGPVVNVAVERTAATSKGGSGYGSWETALSGSPFPARIYRLRSSAYQFYQPPEGMTTIDRLRVVAFVLPAPSVEVGDVCTLPDGTVGRILRLRGYADRVDADLEVGTE
jgi:hypothetical protein